jgi:hypothetical protein
VDRRRHDEDKNRLRVPSGFTGEVSDMFRAQSVPFFRSQAARMAEPDLVAWNENSRLNPARGAAERLDDPGVQASFARLAENMGLVLANLERLAAQTTSLTIA